jgi:hypothetical protein
MPRESFPGAAFGALGLFTSFILSLTVLGLSASAVAQDHQSKIAIAHLVVVCPFTITYTCMPLHSIWMLI